MKSIIFKRDGEFWFFYIWGMNRFEYTITENFERFNDSTRPKNNILSIDPLFSNQPFFINRMDFCVCK